VCTYSMNAYPLGFFVSLSITSHTCKVPKVIVRDFLKVKLYLSREQEDMSLLTTLLVSLAKKINAILHEIKA
jgi:hypothetical protein